jgi:putative DNA primase/helicase
VADALDRFDAERRDDTSLRPNQDQGLRPADLETLSRLGISPELLEAAQVRRVTDEEARDDCGIRYRGGQLAGIWYPNLDPERGTVRSGRLRRDHPERDPGGRPIAKYVGPPDRPYLYFPPGAGPLLGDPHTPVVMVEAEQSALAVTAAVARTGRRLLAIGTGGCWGWRGVIGRTIDATGARVDEKGPLPDLDRLAWRDRDVVVLFDANVATNVGVHQGRRALARALAMRGARARIAELPTEPDINGPDDYVGRHGDLALWALLDRARTIHQESAADVLRVVGLDEIHNVGLADLEGRLRRLKDALQGADQLRKRTVRELLVTALRGEKVSGAAALVDAAIGDVPDEADDHPSAFLADEAPWPDRVDGAALLDRLVATLTRYVVLPTIHTARAIALWVVLTYCDAVVNVLPLLLITSATKRCGKTRTVEVVGGLACRALPISNITTPALYRAIDTFHPTLLLDEGDTFLTEDPELRGVINAGHTRHTARVLRCVGEDSEPTIFSTWCPKLVAMIGTPKDTLIDRSIVITLERKAPGETVDHLRVEQPHRMFVEFRRQIRRWADDHLEAVRMADPTLPPGLHDRAADNWRPLLAIAQLAGGAWPALAAQAAMALAGHDREDDSLAEQLLADLHAIFHDPTTGFDRSQRDRLSTARVTELLVALDSRPWATYNTRSGKPVTQYQVARLLKRFGVRPIKARIDAKPTNCYHRADLEPAWRRYSPPVHGGTAEPPNETGPESTISGRNGSWNSSDSKHAVSSGNSGLVPVFRPEAPPIPGVDDDEREQGDL